MENLALQSDLTTTLQAAINTEIVLEALGLLGVVLYISAYATVQMSWLRAPSIPYNILNALAAGLVLTSLFQNFNLASAIIQVTWISISVYGITALLIRRRRFGFSTRRSPVGA